MVVGGAGHERGPGQADGQVSAFARGGGRLDAPAEFFQGRLDAPGVKPGVEPGRGRGGVLVKGNGNVGQVEADGGLVGGVGPLAADASSMLPMLTIISVGRGARRGHSHELSDHDGRHLTRIDRLGQRSRIDPQKLGGFGPRHGQTPDKFNINYIIYVPILCGAVPRP